MPDPRRIVRGALALSLFVLAPHAAGGEPVKKLLVIGIDGCRPDALAVAQTPVIDALIAEGAFSDVAQVGPNTVSGPGWSNTLTGVWSDRHGVVNNGFGGENLDQYPSFFAHLEQGLPAVDTASLVSWEPIEIYIVQDADFELYHPHANDGDVIITQTAVDRLTNADDDALFVYFADVDVVGHSLGFSPTVPEYVAEIEEVDGQIGQLIAALEARPTYANEDWLVLASSDHGGIGTTHSGGLPEQRTVFYLASGPSAARGVLHTVPNAVDVAATALAHLGVARDPAWELSGRPLGFPEPLPLDVNLIFNGDFEYSTGNSAWDADRGVAGWYDIGNVTTVLYGSPGGFPALDDPGPPNRGANFVSGGPGAASDAMSLTVDVEQAGYWIDQGGVRFDLSGYLGGYADQEDRMSLTASFLDEAGAALGASTIGPVTLADRVAEIGGIGTDLTGLLFRAANDVVPVGTRRVRFEILAEHFTGGGTDGYGDELSFVLSIDEDVTCAGIPFCLGDGAGTACPCGNDNGGHTAGCANSASPAGAALACAGSTSVTQDDLRLRGDGLVPNQPGLYFQGSNALNGGAGATFGDGLRCVGGGVVRLGIVTADLLGTSESALGIASAGGSAPGDLRRYQLWYRDPTAGPCGIGFNLSQGLELVFEP